MGFRLFDFPPETTPSCPLCRDLDPEYVRDDMFHVQFSLEDIERSVGRKCQTCSILKNALAYFKDIGPSAQIRLKQNIEEPFTNGLQLEVESKGSVVISIELYSLAGTSGIHESVLLPAMSSIIRPLPYKLSSRSDSSECCITKPCNRSRFTHFHR
jgi:hypothetical protein